MKSGRLLAPMSARDAEMAERIEAASVAHYV